MEFRLLVGSWPNVHASEAVESQDSAVEGQETGRTSTTMIKTLQQAKRFLKILFGFTLLILGAIMIFTPGPGWVTILLGLGILGAEYVWAQRLLDRVKEQGGRIRDSIFNREKSAAPAAAVHVPPADAVAPNAAETDSREVPASEVR